MAIRIQVKDTPNFRRPSLFKYFFSVFSIGRTVSAKQCCGFCDGKELAEMQLWLCVVFVCCILCAKIY